jgi:hypothetical protein
MAEGMRIPVPHGEIAELCRCWDIARLAFFGSVIRDDFTPESDVDVLVEFADGAEIGLFEMSRIRFALSEILGRKVDLHTPGSLSRYFRDRVLAEAKDEYVEEGRPREPLPHARPRFRAARDDA